ncbi:MAG TPA: helix-turn-helix transcriptional regulator [Actinomycetota bacterium]|nr:helix-turn-helix transcriptional regulator [Actinomycetota bacterium]
MGGRRNLGRKARGRVGVTVSTYRGLEAGTRAPSKEAWDRICKTFGWSQTLVAAP